MTQDSRSAATPRSATLSTRELTLGYGDRKVVDQLSVEVPQAR